MGRITVRTTLELPRATVFDRLTAIDRMPEGSTLRRAASMVTPGSTRQRTRREEANPLDSIPTIGEWVVAAYDRPARLVFEGSTAFVNARVELELEADDGMTRLKQVTDYEFLPRLGPVGQFLESRVFTPMLARGQRQSMLNFKRVVEIEWAEANAARSAGGPD